MLRQLALAALTVVVGGCAATLSPSPVVPATALCASDDDCLATGRAQFHRYRQTKLDLIERASQGYRLPSAPIALLHSRRTEYVALLIHGLNDSAYYMADIADVYYQHGFNVVTVLLPGHGTDSDDMLHATAEEWRSEVETGWTMASLVGHKVVVAGFSLGAVLALDLVLNRADVSGLFLISPALDLRALPILDLASLACLPGARSVMYETDIPPNPVKYKLRSGNGVCQLYRVMQGVRVRGNQGHSNRLATTDKLRQLGSRLQMPTFVAMTYEDARVSPGSIIAFAGDIRGPVTVATFGGPSNGGVDSLRNGGLVVSVADEGLPHSYLLRRSNPYNGQENPYFDRFATVLRDFLRVHFASGNCSGNESECTKFLNAPRSTN